jgi:DNA polymerase-2
VPGIYENILVFDYRSLYPSLIRTFHLDPLNHIRDGAPEQEKTVTAPNGARFLCTAGILPELLSRLFPERERALRRGDRIAATAIKILMNSFYGVLATPRCRFYSSETANAITLFGQKILRWTKDRVEARGLRTLYGDTDSVFVESGLPDAEEARRLGRKLADELNEELESLVHDEYGMVNYLRLQFDQLYTKFFLPGLRHSQEGSKKRYAGLVEEDGTTRLVFTGLESVRRDWTDIAKRFQKDFLTMVFEEGKDIPRHHLEEVIRDFVKRLRDGEMDGLLIYRKALRKEVREYTKTTPPHVKAAQLLGERSGRIISYVMTTDGPQPAMARTAPLDYDHYVEKQIRPIAEAVLQHLGHSWDKIWSRQDELPLF